MHKKKNNIRNTVRVSMCQKLLASKHHRLRDSPFGREKIWVWWLTEKKITGKPRAVLGPWVKKNKVRVLV